VLVFFQLFALLLLTFGIDVLGNNVQGWDELGECHFSGKACCLFEYFDNLQPWKSNIEAAAESHEGVNVHGADIVEDAVESRATATRIRRFAVMLVSVPQVRLPFPIIHQLMPLPYLFILPMPMSPLLYGLLFTWCFVFLPLFMFSL